MFNNYYLVVIFWKFNNFCCTTYSVVQEKFVEFIKVMKYSLCYGCELSVVFFCTSIWISVITVLWLQMIIRTDSFCYQSRSFVLFFTAFSNLVLLVIVLTHKPCYKKGVVVTLLNSSTININAAQTSYLYICKSAYPLLTDLYFSVMNPQLLIVISFDYASLYNLFGFVYFQWMVMCAP